MYVLEEEKHRSHSGVNTENISPDPKHSCSDGLPPPWDWAMWIFYTSVVGDWTGDWSEVEKKKEEDWLCRWANFSFVHLLKHTRMPKHTFKHTHTQADISFTDELLQMNDRNTKALEFGRLYGFTGFNSIFILELEKVYTTVLILTLKRFKLTGEQ